ncbi:RNA-guided endonuclease IscB [Azohydromonas australica]|uniref:RNA-guided endonuclease IscB n=1 Tax=Azohydromonas australica TaxID=364039 RepID=UPI000403597C|nr:RNA-guided endonuclease IscB [Azohydromonas australica]
MSVFVLDRSKKPLMPCSEKRARKLLTAGRARVHRMYPFTIRLLDRTAEDSALQPLRLSIDPGSKATGLALCRVEDRVDADTGEAGEPALHIVALVELVHRGQAIRDSLRRRAMLRRSRRGRNTRYRAPRFDNRGGKRTGWLAPSLLHRVETTLTWVRRLRRWAPVSELAQELVRFDMQLMQARAAGKGIEGVEYQRGELAGFEVGEYLLAKWGRRCAYCDAEGVPLEKDHIVARARGGSDRVSNLALACRPCNRAKGAQDVGEFLAHAPARLARILAHAKAPLKDAAAVNATRWRLFNDLKSTGLPLQTASGGRTKFNRTRLALPKTHVLDAACVGRVGEVLRTAQPTLQVQCNGRGSRSRTRLDAHGFPRGYLMREKSVLGFRTGDMVHATVPASSRKAGTWVGRVAVRSSGSFNVQTAAGTVQGINHRHCRVLMRGDGYGYQLVAQHRKESGYRDGASRRALSLFGLKAEVSRAV